MQNTTTKKNLLIIMDGWGIGKKKEADAIQQAHTPFINSLYSQYPHTTLTPFGEAVGLPEGQMGNSEVGHLNLGAGRIVYQELQKIHNEFKTKNIIKNPAFIKLISYLKNNHKPLHIMGLLSNGGVHAHINHLKQLCALLHEEGIKEVYIHAFTDGRDTDPKSGVKFIAELEAALQQTVGKIVTIIGRYYAMDRDNRWERIQLAYNALIKREGQFTDNLLQTVAESYKNGITDEFLKPIITDKQARINPDDALLCFNFRTDRCREISTVLTQVDKPEWGMKKIPLFYVTFTRYDHQFKNIEVLFENSDLKNTLGDILSHNNKTQLRIAETEKYPHVTFFFSGGREDKFSGEERILVPSPKVATYDLQPQMSAFEITDQLLQKLEQVNFDFICLNFANADMVGHTGVFKAAVQAAATVDSCVAKIVPFALKKGYTIFLTADHGNSDYMINEDGSPNTQHSMNLVPLIVIDNHYRSHLNSGKLADIAPTILQWMGLPIPPEMTGAVLMN
ncbi:MAG: 2,3-bisphosphoglycerate-independent phosphoglycerate mutase [Phycisphaerales bacterium]|nr:2,3-bisphosphoglycerate-independent phosphoglycerate mutase [Phycisphaerales bacterium]